MREEVAGPSSGGAQERGPEVSWPVGAVAQRVGLPAPTLRSWDRRYGVGPTERTEGNHRRYTDGDIRRVRLMSRLTARGVPAQAAAEVVLAMDGEAIEQRLAAEADAGPGATAPSAAETVDAIVSAATALDGRALANLYRQTTRQHALGRAWGEVFAPALREIGQRWSEGRIGVESEHLASELLQSELRAIVQANRARVSGPPIMLASADNEHHHLPLLALDAALSLSGAATIFLGPRVPASAMVGALNRARPQALFVWASMRRPAAEPWFDQLRSLPWPLTVVLGGPGWPPEVSADGGVALVRATDLDGAVRVLLASRVRA